MKTGLRLFALITLGASLMWVSCNNSSGVNDGPFYQVNEFIQVNMDYYYFWNDLVPDNIPGDTRPQDYFDSMLDAGDEFSYMTNDYQALLNNLNGNPRSTGISPTFSKFNNSDRVFVVVEFVYAGTPADAAGFKRGDIIMRIDGEEMNEDNYQDLYYADGNPEYTLGAYDEESNSISETDSVVAVSKEMLQTDPVIETRVFEQEGVKTGYIYYARFINGEDDRFIESVDNALADFASQGISELIIDLRYNPGGTITAAKNIGNSLAPEGNINAEDIFVSFKYNDELQAELEENEGPDSPNLNVRFSSDPTNLNLDRVFFLTTSSSASASELLINGLSPYMDVVTIGTPTFGKFYGSFVLTGQNSRPPNSYAIVPVVLKYANALGVTDFRDGLEVDHEVQDRILDGVPLGDPSDPLLAKALELITGQPPAKVNQGPYPALIKLDDRKSLKTGNILITEKF